MAREQLKAEVLSPQSQTRFDSTGPAGASAKHGAGPGAAGQRTPNPAGASAQRWPGPGAAGPVFIFPHTYGEFPHTDFGIGIFPPTDFGNGFFPLQILGGGGFSPFRFLPLEGGLLE